MPEPDAAPVVRPIPYAEALAPEDWFGGPPQTALELRLVELAVRGNLPLAEILARQRLAELGTARAGESARMLGFLGGVASAAALPEQARALFQEAARRAPDATPARESLELLGQRQGPSATGQTRKPADRFLLIKAWGYGFWSDVSHVLGQLLIAEVSGRIPIVHWGANSLFGDAAAENAFDLYFEPVSALGVEALRDARLRIWPPKWHQGNLLSGEVNKWQGPFSRLAGLYLLGRPEELVVSDFFTSIFELQPWIPKDSPLHGLTVGRLYAQLLAKYLRPRPELAAEVEAFYSKHLADADFIAVHARGSDKRKERQDLDETNRQYPGLIDELRTQHGIERIFLMTDDAHLQDRYLSLYGDDLVCTDCQRTDTHEGVHLQAERNRRRLGVEVAVDVYLAARGKVFIGNAWSNPSQMVRYLKPWPPGHAILIGQPDMSHSPNAALHAW
jgi:hypothetical protein